MNASKELLTATELIRKLSTYPKDMIVATPIGWGHWALKLDADVDYDELEKSIDYTEENRAYDERRNKEGMLNFKKGNQPEIDTESINFLDLGYGRTRYEEEVGEAPPEGMFFVDIDEEAGPDALWNLDEGIPLPDSSIGGTINLGYIIAYLQNPGFVAQEVLRVAASGATIKIGTYISTDNILQNLSAWGLTPADAQHLKEEVASWGGEEDPEWAEKTSTFIKALGNSAQLVEREFLGVYDAGSQVSFTFQVV